MELQTVSHISNTNWTAFVWCRAKNRQLTPCFVPQFVCEAPRSSASVSWLTQWRRPYMQPVRTASPKEAVWPLPCRDTRTTSSTTTYVRASAQRSTSGWASMTWWPTATGWTSQAQVCASRTGRRRSPCSQTEGAARTAASSPPQPTGSGLMRAAELKRLLCVSSTSSEGSLLSSTSLCADKTCERYMLLAET